DPQGPNPPPEYVGITCAGCHTAQINYKGLGLRIDGAPGQLDLNTFLQYIGLAANATYFDPLKLDRFAKRVLGASYNGATRDQLKQDLKKFIDTQLQAILQQINADRQSGLKPTSGGFGRLDALGQGGNTLFGKLSTKNLRTLNAPVDIIPLWYANSY